MHETLELACQALDTLGQFVVSTIPEKKTFIETRGWNTPAVTATELAEIPQVLANQIRNADIDDVSGELEQNLKLVPGRLELLQKHTVPQMVGNNATQAIPAYMATIQWISTLVQPHLFWESIHDPKMMPAMLAKKMRTIKRQLEEINIDKDELLSQIKLVQEAADTAEALPADLISLKESREKVAEISSKSTRESDKISELAETASIQCSEINETQTKANKLIDKCEEAYRVTTTKGLAGAFEVREKSLSKSMWVWVAGLLGALYVGAHIGSERLGLLTKAMMAETPDMGIITMQATLSVLSLGAPLWFAWLATKQIGQRFKLAEDYAFKASVAKAYEGYRKEAVRIDEAFEARLFSAALSRVEEAPLRLLNDDDHGSPWHELVSSPAFMKALDQIPEFRDTFIQLAKSGIHSAKGLSQKQTKEDRNKESQEES